VGAELFHGDGQTDRQDELIVALRNVAKAPNCGKKGKVTKQKQKKNISS